MKIKHITLNMELDVDEKIAEGIKYCMIHDYCINCPCYNNENPNYCDSIIHNGNIYFPFEFVLKE